MDNKLLGIIMAVVLVSGCSQLPSGSEDTTSEDPQQISGKGLEVEEFSVSDKTLSPGQTITVDLKLKNYHREDIQIGNIALYNLGLLESSDKSCVPKQIDPAENGVYPVMECSWRITAPSEDQIGGFEQRQSTISVNIPYESAIRNYQPMTIKFRPLEQISRTDKQATSFSNGEVGVEMEVETPVPLKQKKNINFKVSKQGSGSIDGSYDFEYTPSNIFEGCPESDEPIIRDSLEFSCNIESTSSQEVERNLFFTAHYKYNKAPNTDITLVNK